MKDYVNCVVCGMVINSDFAKYINSCGRPIFFCSNKHLEDYTKEEL